MATYNFAAVANAVIAFKKGITLQMLRAMRDNPIAMAEGAPGAPKVQGVALGGISMGYINASAPTPSGYIDCDRFETIVGFGYIFAGAATSLEVRYSDNNGSSYGSYQTVIGSIGAGNHYFNARLNLRTGVVFAISNSGLGGGGTHTVPANCNAFQMRVTGGSGTVLVLDCFCIGGRP